MSKIVIVTESGSDLSAELAKEYGVHIVPMHVSFGDVTKDDGFFPSTEIGDYFNITGQVPMTSGCNPQDFQRVFEEILDMEPEACILHLAYSAATTCSYQSAITAAEGNPNIRSVDTKNVSVGLACIVVRMARLLKRHPEWTLDQAAEVAGEISKKARFCFVPGQLDYLKAGGRVSNKVALIGNILNIHPRIDLMDGTLIATQKYRGKIDRILTRILKEYPIEEQLDQKELWICYTPKFPETSQELAVKLAKQMGFQRVHMVKTGGVITSHSGPNSFGVAAFTK